MTNEIATTDQKKNTDLAVLVGLDTCVTPAQIERVFMCEIKKDQYGNHDDLRKVCNARAIEIAPNLKRGNLLPKRVDKHRGCSMRFVIDGEEYKTGTWGNGAGARYAMAYYEQWAEQKLREGGLRSKGKISSIISWASSDYLWRALRYLVG